MLKAGDAKVETKTMSHANGVWAGPRPKWVTVTHEATGFSVTYHEHTDGKKGQHRDYQSACACLDMLIEELQPKCLPLDFNE